MRPWLVLDCYLQPGGGAHNFVPHVHPRPVEVVRAKREPMPGDPRDFSGVVITGSAASCITEPPAWVAPAADFTARAAAAGLPVIGICFGHQLLALALGGPGSVRRSAPPEVGWLDAEILRPDPLLRGLSDPFRVFLSHEDEVSPDTTGIEILARTPSCPVQVLRARGGPQWGVQFHTEMGPEEEAELVRWRARRHPELGIDPAAMLSRAQDSGPLARLLFANFFRAVGA